MKASAFVEQDDDRLSRVKVQLEFLFGGQYVCNFLIYPVVPHIINLVHCNRMLA